MLQVRLRNGYSLAPAALVCVVCLERKNTSDKFSGLAPGDPTGSIHLSLGSWKVQSRHCDTLNSIATTLHSAQSFFNKKIRLPDPFSDLRFGICYHAPGFPKRAI